MRWKRETEVMMVLAEMRAMAAMWVFLSQDARVSKYLTKEEEGEAKNGRDRGFV